MKTFEELRKMSADELSDFFDVSERIASGVKSGLNENYYVILADKSLTAYERAEQSGLTKKTAENYRSCLLIAGLAEPKITHIPYKSTYAVILKAITKPIDVNELEEKIKLKHYILRKEIRNLQREGRLYEFKLVTSGSTGLTYHSRELFGELMNTIYIYRPGQEKAAAKVIAEKLPLDKILKNKPMRVALTCHFKNRLPQSIFKHLYKLYHPK